MNRAIFILGLISPIALPLLGAMIQQWLTLFHYPEINTVIPLTFFLTGLVTGGLMRT